VVDPGAAFGRGRAAARSGRGGGLHGEREWIGTGDGDGQAAGDDRSEEHRGGGEGAESGAYCDR